MLYVDADDEPRRALSGQFRKLGWRVSEARDVRSAVEAALEAQPRVILTRLQLPDAIGFHFVRTFRSTIEHDVVLVGITSLPVHLCIGAKLAGLDLIVEKPLNVERVHRSILASMPPNASPIGGQATKVPQRISSRDA